MVRRVGLKAVQRIISRPSPVGGLNVRDAPTEMPPTDCVVSKNWIPYPFGSRVRKGWREWATNMGSNPVRSLLIYYAPTSTTPVGQTPSRPTTVTGKLFAATDANIYDVSTSTNAPGVSRALSGTTYAGHFSQCMFVNTAGTFLLVASELGGYSYYNGAAWTVPTFGGGAGQIGGIDPANIIFVFAWKRRVWFVQKNSASLWYLPTDQITGTAVEFPLGPFLKLGGSVSLLANWTIDAGTGLDDMLVAVSERGEVLVYKGTDPASISTFQLIGSWNIGEIPKGRRCALQYGGDLLLLSNDGLFPLSHVTRGGAQLLQASDDDYTSKIQDIITTDLIETFSMYGWSMQMYARDSLLIVSSPDYGSVTKRQYVMSTLKNAWCTFSDIPVYCMGQSSGYLFAGTPDGRVIIMQDGYFDSVLYGATTGNGIVGELQPAFDYFEKPGQNKNFLAVRPTFLSVDTPAVAAQLNVNFSLYGPTSTPVLPAPQGSLWNTAKWNLSTWAGSMSVFQPWLGVNGVGYTGSLNLKTVTAGDTALASIDYMVEDGGPL